MFGCNMLWVLHQTINKKKKKSFDQFGLKCLNQAMYNFMSDYNEACKFYKSSSFLLLKIKNIFNKLRYFNGYPCNIYIGVKLVKRVSFFFSEDPKLHLIALNFQALYTQNNSEGL